ncbi:MAG: ATP-binding protein [Spirochaetota bacterium]
MLVTSSGSIIALVASIINYTTGQHVAMTLLAAASAVALLLLRRQLLREPVLLPYLLVVTAIGLALGITGWLTSDGLYGSAPYIFYLTLAWLLAIRDSRSHFRLVMATVVIISILIILQFQYPSLVIAYPSSLARNSDLITGVLGTLVFQAIFISALRRQFQHERSMLAARNEELQTLSERFRQETANARTALADRSDFLAAMSHELRTPLTSVIAGSRLLRGEKGEESREEIMGSIERSAQSLLRLIDDLLVLRSSEAGEISIINSPFSIRELLRDITRNYLPLSESKGLKFRVVLDDAVPEIVSSDAARIEQMIANLLSNAIKYTEEGQVSLSVSADPDQDLLVFEVTDTGVGVSEADRPGLFLPFTRARETRRQVRGTGLGLSVCSLLAEKMGGSISLAESNSAGSTFVLSLPLLTAAKIVERDTRDDRPDGFAGMKILVAEDDEVNALLLTRIIERLSASVHLVRNGRDLVHQATHSEWDFIITDIQMPGLDGLEAARQIRACDGRSRSVPIIAISASNIDEEQSRARNAGISDWITKPFEHSSLMMTLRKYLDQPV